MRLSITSVSSVAWKNEFPIPALDDPPFCVIYSLVNKTLEYLMSSILNSNSFPTWSRHFTLFWLWTIGFRLEGANSHPCRSTLGCDENKQNIKTDMALKNLCCTEKWTVQNLQIFLHYSWKACHRYMQKTIWLATVNLMGGSFVLDL